MRCLDGIIDSMDMNLSKLQEPIKDREDWCVSPWVAMSETGTEQQQAKFKLMNKKTRGKTIRVSSYAHI